MRYAASSLDLSSHSINALFILTALLRQRYGTGTSLHGWSLKVAQLSALVPYIVETHLTEARSNPFAAIYRSLCYETPAALEASIFAALANCVAKTLPYKISPAPRSLGISGVFWKEQRRFSPALDDCLGRPIRNTPRRAHLEQLRREVVFGNGLPLLQ